MSLEYKGTKNLEKQFISWTVLYTTTETEWTVVMESVNEQVGHAFGSVAVQIVIMCMCHCQRQQQNQCNQLQNLCEFQNQFLTQ